MKRALLLLLALLLFPACAQAQNSLPANDYALILKGVLYNNDGKTPLSVGTYNVTFKLYDNVDPRLGHLVFQELQSVDVKTIAAPLPGQADHRGRYSVTLGVHKNGAVYDNLLPATAFQGKTLYLEITVSGLSPTPRSVITQVPADSTIGKSMNQIVWVTNALNHIENTDSIETAALAFYINQIYAVIPDADPNFVVRSVIKAQDTFNQRYRSTQTGGFRVIMLPLDAVVNMYGLLVQQPGNPVTLPTIGESLNFTFNALDLKKPKYQQFSYELGRMSTTATFNDYTASQLEKLYLLGRTNANAAIVINTLFSFPYKAKISDSSFAILKQNPDLRDSDNFAPLRTQIENDGTLLSTLDTLSANISDFYDRMTVATRTVTTAMAAATAYQKTDFIAATSNSNAPAIVNAFAVANSVQAGPLNSADAAKYTTGVIAPTLNDDQYGALTKALAGMQLATTIAQTAADAAKAVVSGTLINPENAINNGIQAGVDLFNVASASINVALQNATSPTDVIKEQITLLSGQLHDVQQQINGRLDIIDQNIAQLYSQMDTDFKNLQKALTVSLTAIQTSVDNLVTNVVQVQFTLDRLTQDFSAFATDSNRSNKLVQPLTDINNWASNPPAFRPTQSVFDTTIAACQSYATSDCLNASLENGNKTHSGFSSQYSDSSILGELDGNSEKNLNYLLAFAYNRFINHSSGSADLIYTAPNATGWPASQSASVVNPTAWEMSCMGMMRGVTTYPDLGQKFAQYTTAFSAPYAEGAHLQDAANRITIQQNIFTGNVEASPVLHDMLLHQNKMATNLYNTLLAAENGAADVPTQVANIQAAYASTSNPYYASVKQATDNLNASRRLLEQFVEFGLSRTIKTNQLLGSLLYTQGDPTFVDPTVAGNPSRDPNAQRLPDGDWVQSLYQNWIPSVVAAPVAPVLSASGTGATLPTGSYYIIVTTVDGSGRESLPSSETALAFTYGTNGTTLTQGITLGQTLTVSHPSSANGATKYRVYIGESTQGPYYLQNGTGTPINTNYVQSVPIANANSNSLPPQYHQYVTGDPLQRLAYYQAERWEAMELLVAGNFWSGPTLFVINNQNVPDFRSLTLDTSQHNTTSILDRLVTDAMRTGLLLGEPLANVEAVQQRLSYFLIPTVAGKIAPAALTNLPSNEQPKSLAKAVVTMTFTHNSLDSFVAPVLLDSLGQFIVYVPKNIYNVTVKAPDFLQAKIQAPGQVAGVIDTTGNNDANGTIRLANQNVTASLIIGDLNGDNTINNTDLLLVRNATGSMLTTPDWDGRFDLNGDGIVDFRDQILLEGAFGATTSDRRYLGVADFNNDGVVDSQDTTALAAHLGQLKADPANGGNPTVGWDAKYDLNSDGIVDYKDQEIIQGKLSTTTSSLNWDSRFDFNANGNIGTDDVTLFLTKLGTRKSSLNWNPLADLNGDGVVDNHDMNMLRANYGAKGQK